MYSSGRDVGVGVGLASEIAVVMVVEMALYT
jgi:hypothetical protein